MLLSKLVYLCIKNVVYLNDASFNYKDFVNGEFDNDIDYSMSINNVFSPLNEAISRLSDLNRIPFIIEKVITIEKVTYLKRKYFRPNIGVSKVYQPIGTENVDVSFNEVKDTLYINGVLNSEYPVIVLYDDGVISNFTTDKFTVSKTEEKEIDLNQFSTIVKEVIGVAQNNKSLIFKQKYIDSIAILSPIISSEPIYVEYKEDIKTFNRDDICPIEEDEVDNNIDLRERYGISESACSFIMEYVQGKLLEPMAPELSNLHITRAENYFSNLQPAKSFTSQNVTYKKYVIGE